MSLALQILIDGQEAVGETLTTKGARFHEGESSLKTFGILRVLGGSSVLLCNEKSGAHLRSHTQRTESPLQLSE